MAVWQFEMTPISASDAAQAGLPTIRLSQRALDAKLLTFSGDKAEALAARLSHILPEGRGWLGTRIWGDEKQDDVQAFETADGFEWPHIRINVGSISLPLIQQFCALARDYGWVFIGKDGSVIQPRSSSVLREIEKSPAFKFVRDPEAFVANIAAAEARPDEL